MHPGDGGEQGFATVQPAGSSLVVPPPLLFSSTDHDGPCRVTGRAKLEHGGVGVPSCRPPVQMAVRKIKTEAAERAMLMVRADELQPW